MSRVRNHKPLGALMLAIASLALIGVGSSCSDSSSPPASSPGGPALNFKFMAPGESHQYQFTTAGIWAYHCLTHQGAPMVGTVIVDSTSTVDSVLVDVGGQIPFRFTPEVVTIKRNGWVRWVNTSGLTTHTVTRP